MIEKLNLRQAMAYLWDMKAKHIERIENEARPKFAKIFDKVVGKRRHKSSYKMDNKYSTSN